MRSSRHSRRRTRRLDAARAKPARRSAASRARPASAGGRGQSDEPEARLGPARSARAPRVDREQRASGGGTRGAGAVRRDPDGRADAGDERARSDGSHSRGRTPAPAVISPSWRSPPARWPATANNAWPPAWTPTSPSRCGRKSCSRPSTRSPVWRPRRRTAGSRKPEADQSGSSVERSALLAGFGGRGDLVKQVIDVFLTDAPAMLTRLNEAARASNAAELAAAAHAIKGSAGLFSQGEAYDDARALELRARGGDISAADRACQDVERSVSRLMTELEQHPRHALSAWTRGARIATVARRRDITRGRTRRCANESW